MRVNQLFELFFTKNFRFSTATDAYSDRKVATGNVAIDTDEFRTRYVARRKAVGVSETPVNLKNSEKYTHMLQMW